MEVEYDSQDSNPDVIIQGPALNGMDKEIYIEDVEYDDGYNDSGYSSYGAVGVMRGDFSQRSRVPHPGWGPPTGGIRYRRRGYVAAGPAMRPIRPPVSFYRSRNVQRYGGAYDANWAPMMGAQPPAMMNGPTYTVPQVYVANGPMVPQTLMSPYGGPSLVSQELWVETKADDGKSYFYHIRTRETTWTRPDGPNCKVILQADIEEMVANGTVNIILQQDGGPLSPSGSNGLKMVNDDNANDVYCSQMGYQEHFQSQYNTWQPAWPPPTRNQVPTIIDVSQERKNPSRSAGMQNTQMGNTSHHSVHSMGVQTAPQQVIQVKKEKVQNREETQSPPPELVAEAKKWTTHKAPDGKNYYYNASKSSSVWEKPQPLKDFERWEQTRRNYKNRIGAGKFDYRKEKDVIEILDEDEPEVIAVEVATAPAAVNVKDEEKEVERKKQLELEKEMAKAEKAEKEKAEKEKTEKEKQSEMNKSKPITSTPISGTHWWVAWTGDFRVFFYNPTVPTSVWERPECLIGRADVDEAVSTPPAAVLALMKKEKVDSKVNGTTKRSGDDLTLDSDAEPNKKPKQDTVKADVTVKAVVQSEAKSTSDAPEAEKKAAIERALIPLEQRTKLFKELLEEKQVSAFSTWEKELQKIVFDERYLILNSKERKQVFDKYVRERADEELKEKRRKLKQKKDDFRALCEQAKLHSKSSFADFAAKFGKEERFRGIDKVRERESLFNEFILELRKREKEEKDKKREQAKKEFIAMLREKEVDRHTRWSEAKKLVEEDLRYKAVDSSSAREESFREYCRLMKEEKKKGIKDKDKDKDPTYVCPKEKKDKEKKGVKKDKDKIAEMKKIDAELSEMHKEKSPLKSPQKSPSPTSPASESDVPKKRDGLRSATREKEKK